MSLFFFEFFTWCICFFIQFIFQKIFLLKQRHKISLLDRLEQIYCWSPFEILREKIMLSLCYLLHLFCILAITFCSKFQLIRNLCFLKGNSILYNFYRNREIQISMFSRPKMWFKLLLKIMTFSKHFSILFFISPEFF